MRVTFDETQKALFENHPVDYIKNRSNLSIEDRKLALKAVGHESNDAEQEEASRLIAEKLALSCWNFPRGQSWTQKAIPIKIDIE